MQHEVFDGMVVRAWDSGDHDRYLSVLTAERGRVTVLAKGGKSMRGEQRSLCQPYGYCNFEVYRRGTLYILKGGSLTEPFYRLTETLDRLSLAAYLCDIVCEVTDEGEPAADVLQLALNAMYALNRDRYPYEIVKAAFELRVAFLSGYAPSLAGCSVCGKETADPMYLDVMNGALLCPDCLKTRAGKGKGTGVYDDIREAEILSPLPPAALAAVRYVASAPAERVFSFALQDTDDLRLFAKGAETYLLSHLGRGFDSLNFYQSVKGTKP